MNEFQSHPWTPALQAFTDKTMPRLLKIGRQIGAKSANDPKAKEIIELYARLHKSFDPMTATLLEKALDEYETATNI